MRRSKLLLILGGFLALLSAGVLFAAASAESLRPGGRLLGVQDFAERARSTLLLDPTAKAEYELQLFDRRLTDLARVANTPDELPALARVSASMDRAALAVARAPESPPGTLLRARLARMGERAAQVQASLTVVRTKYAAIHDRFRVKLRTLRAIAADRTLSQVAFGRVAGIPIPFPDDATRRAAFVAAGREEPLELRHGLFPLDGAHGILACTSCHADQSVRDNPRAQSAGPTPRNCAACHQPGKSPDHPIGSCAACHITFSWSGVRFNHRAGAVPTCQDCHVKDMPAFHSRDDCASCHNADSWGGLRFDHVAVGLVDCKGCHASSRPAAHSGEQCSVCHPASDQWSSGRSPNQTASQDTSDLSLAAEKKPLNTLHPTGEALDCQGCHTSTRPASHFQGQCSECHATGTAWKPVIFNHKGRVDCQACHSAVRPADHYAGQCSECHAADTAWKPATFNHKGRVDCQACHGAVRPTNHYAGQCSECHTAGTGWKPASFSHQGRLDCKGCHAAKRPANHFQGQCSECHTAGPAWKPASFSHQGGVDCQECHVAVRPADHYPGQCSECHAPGTDWRPIRFNHALAGADAGCGGCHGSQRPANHFQGQCSECHDAGADWRPVRFNHDLAGADADCGGCHEDRRPQGHSGGQCSACHNVSGWTPANFSHQTAGAGADCQGCHEGQRPANHLQGQCSECHNTGPSWQPSTITHTFPMDHKDANGSCTTCHPSATRDWSCFGCHDQGELERKHSEKGISDFVGRCMSCHPNGREHDD